MEGSSVLDFNAALTQEAAEAFLKRGTVDADDIRSRLHADPQGFVQWLYSGRALIARGEARIGDVMGSAGGSLSISLRGADAGCWFDHATGEKGGDLISLYMAYFGYGNDRFVLALKEIASEYLGDPVEVPRAPWDASAARRIETKAKELGTKPRDDMVELGPKVADWKYRDLHGNIIASVARYEPEGGEKTYRPFCFKDEDGKKVWKMGAPTLRPLFRLPEIATCQHVVLVEGEKCAQALADLGIDATTAMQGAEAPIEKTDWSTLYGKTITIWPDNDQPGRDYAARVAAHLTAVGCHVSIVSVPDGKPKGWDAADCIRDGEDPREVLRTATQPEPPKVERFPIYSWDAMAALPPPAWLVKGFVPQGGFVGLYGPSGHNKSFAVVDMAGCVATGREWHGNATTQCPVLYIVGEGQRGVRKRLQAWQQERGALSGLYVMPVSPTLPADLEATIAAIATMEAAPGLIIIDTLARSFSGNENDAEDMGDWLRATAAIQRRFSATLIFVHHTGKDLDKRDRGHSSLRAAADTMIRVQKSGERGVLVQVDKQKDDEELSIALRTVVVTVGKDDNDEPITSLVLVRDETTVKGTEPPQTPRSRVQQSVLDALEKAGRPLGWASLMGMVQASKSTLSAALSALVEEGMVVCHSDETGSTRTWELAE